MAENKKEKSIDFEMLIFFLGITLLNLIFYIYKHPIVITVDSTLINMKALIYAYLLDLVIFLLVIIPYLISLIIALFYIFMTKKRVSNNIFILLFFPLFAFFSKSMFLPQVYTSLNIIEIIKDNFAFFAFLLFGPIILLIQRLIRYILKIDNNEGVQIEQ